jgi:hypothetical protein
MARRSRVLAPLIAATYDFSAHAVVADVGGGNGTLLSEILRRNPSQRGILVDQPHVLEAARETLADAGVGARCRVETADFFEAVPAGANAYVLKHVLHDWDDERCATILRRCRAAMTDDGVLLVIERLVPDRIEPTPAARNVVLSDLHMLAVNEGGRERTIGELERLLGEAGFALARVHAVPTSVVNVVEARPAGLERAKVP